MPKRDRHPPAETSKKRTDRKQEVADGKTRASQPRSGRSGSDSNAGKKNKAR